jgi:hypothetical protein
MPLMHKATKILPFFVVEWLAKRNPNLWVYFPANGLTYSCPYPGVLLYVRFPWHSFGLKFEIQNAWAGYKCKILDRIQNRRFPWQK